MKKIIFIVLLLTLLSGCGNKTEKTKIYVFSAASLNNAMTEISEKYKENNNDVDIIINSDSSGTLLTQIEEGYECDIFFSAAVKQMNKLEEDGMVYEDTRKDLLNNQLVVITQKDSNTKVTGLKDIANAKNIALAGGSVPAGKYTREALANLGILGKCDDLSKIETKEISDALSGVEISEQDNVSKVLLAIAEGSCEVGTTYFSDTYGYEDKVRILEKVDTKLTGDVIYPVCLVKNSEADAKQKTAAEDFFEYIKSNDAKIIFDKYYFDTSLE